MPCSVSTYNSSTAHYELSSGPDAGRTSNLLSLPPWLLRTRAAAVASKPDIYTQPNRSYYGHDRVFVKQIDIFNWKSMKINWNFLKLRWMPKEHLRQLFWRSTDLTFLQIIIVASRPTLPFSWGGGRRFVTGRRQIKDRRRETMDLHQALQTSDKSTTTASYAFNHIPKTLHQLYHLSTRTQHSVSTFDIATFDDRHAITISYLN